MITLIALFMICLYDRRDISLVFLPTFIIDVIIALNGGYIN